MSIKITEVAGRYGAFWESRVEPSIELEGTGETREEALDALAGLIDALLGELSEALEEAESL